MVSEEMWKEFEEYYLANKHLLGLDDKKPRCFKNVDTDVIQYIQCHKPYWEMYQGMVRLIAAIFNPIWHPAYYRDGIHELDHKMSIAQGFAQSVPVYYIANYSNIEVLTINQNMRKGISCSISKEELYETAICGDVKYNRMVALVLQMKDLAKLRYWRHLVLNR